MKNLQRFLIASMFFGSFGVAPAVSAADYARDSSASIDTLQTKQDDVNQLLRDAFELYKQKKYDEALAKCVKAAQLAPKDFRAPLMSGLVYMAQWKMKSASEEFAKAIALKPDDKQLYLFKAKADNLRDAKEEALAATRKALEIDPSFAEAYLLIGDILRFDEKRRDEALAAYRSALKIKPDLPEPYENLGEMLLEAKDEKGAEEIFRKGMEVDPKKMAGRFALGRLLVKQGRLKEARAVWEVRTSDKDDTFPNFIDVLERAEKLQEATAALAKNPNDPATLVRMGNAVMEGDSWVVDGRQERAITYFKKALKIKPNFAPAQYGITKAAIQIADTFESKKKAVDEELEKLRKIDPKLAAEMEEYRKNYSGGIKTAPLNTDQ